MLQDSSTSFNRQKSVDSASGPYGRSRYGSDSNGSVDSGEELDNNSDDGGNYSANKKFELMEMDLYILSEKSPMYMHLKSAWNNGIFGKFFFFFLLSKLCGCASCVLTKFYMLYLLNFNSLDKKMGKSMVTGNFVSHASQILRTFR